MKSWGTIQQTTEDHLHPALYILVTWCFKLLCVIVVLKAMTVVFPSSPYAHDDPSPWDDPYCRPD